MQEENEVQSAERERSDAEVIAEGAEHLRRLREQNNMLERMMAPKITVVKSRGFFTRHVRSRAERVATRKAQRAARRANR